MSEHESVAKMREAAANALNRLDAGGDCEHNRGAEPDTGAGICSLESRDGYCICGEVNDVLSKAQALIRALPLPAEPAPVHMHGRHFAEPGPVVVDTPYPPDAALKLAREALEPFSAEAGNFDRQRPDNILLDIPIHLRDLRKAAAALAAIDAITGGGNAD